jgi:hypothetical protein
MNTPNSNANQSVIAAAAEVSKQGRECENREHSGSGGHARKRHFLGALVNGCLHKASRHGADDHTLHIASGNLRKTYVPRTHNHTQTTPGHTYQTDGNRVDPGLGRLELRKH